MPSLGGSATLCGWDWGGLLAPQPGSPHPGARGPRQGEGKAAFAVLTAADVATWLNG